MKYSLNKLAWPDPTLGFAGAIKQTNNAIANRNPSIAQKRNSARFQNI
jgi:hypothetical protein